MKTTTTLLIAVLASTLGLVHCANEPDARTSLDAQGVREPVRPGPSPTPPKPPDPRPRPTPRPIDTGDPAPRPAPGAPGR